MINPKILLLVSFITFSIKIFGVDWYIDDNDNSNDIYTIGSSSGNDGSDGSSTTPFATLEKALSVASDGDFIYIDAGTYYDITLIITQNNLSIIGAGSQLVTFDAGEFGITTNKYFIDIYGDNCTLQGFTADRYIYDTGGTGKAITVNSGLTTSFRDVSATNVAGSGGDGAFLIKSGATVNFDKCNSSCNSGLSTGTSGGITIDGNNITVVMDSCLIANNNSGDNSNGAGIRIQGGTNGSTNVFVFNSSFLNNIGGHGGGIFIIGQSILDIRNSCFENNQATKPGTYSGYGGALCLGERAMVFVDNCIFTNNSTDPTGKGGAIALNTLLTATGSSVATLGISNSSFTGNSSSEGNHIYGKKGYSNIGVVSISECTFDGVSDAIADDDIGDLTWTIANSGDYSAGTENTLEITNIIPFGASNTTEPIVIPNPYCPEADGCSISYECTPPASPSGDQNQEFCTIDNPTIEDLSATGTEIVWYESSSSLTSLDLNTILVNGEDYFASQVIDNCESVNRFQVVVTLNDSEAPSNENSQSFCDNENATISDLTVSGSNINWYDNPSNGNILSATHSLENNSIYYASQNTEGCESSVRTPLTVELLSTPEPIADTIQMFCGAENPTLSNLSPSGSNISWYDSNSNESPLDINVSILNNNYYFCEQTILGCPSNSRLAIKTILFENTIDTLNPISICFGDSILIGSSYKNQTGTYNDTLSSIYGCDSILTIDLEIIDDITSLDTKESCDSLEWEGTIYTTSGEFDQTFQAINGCDSIVTLDLTINESTTVDTSATACNSFNWYGSTYTNTNQYTHTIIASTGCDSILRLNLSINGYLNSDTSAIVCDSINWHGNTYSNSGNYDHILQNSLGCDSIVRLNLTVNQSVIIDTNATICDSINWHGNTYSTSGNYGFTSQTINGCDSTVSLHLIVNQSSTADTTATACDSAIWYGNKYSVSGDYNHVLPTATGCDSIVTINLTIYSSVNTNANLTACDSTLWNSNSYFNSGVYVETLHTTNGCDSLVTLDLTIIQSSFSDTAVSSCDSLIWNGNTYLTSGDFEYSTINENGCDSTIRLNLSINNSISTIDTQFACESYQWINGNTYFENNNSAEFTLQTENGCDSTVNLDLIISYPSNVIDSLSECDSLIWIDGNTYFEDDTTSEHLLINTDGCDSLVKLNLTINNSFIISKEKGICIDEFPYEWDGLIFNSEGNQSLFLNSLDNCDSIVNYNIVSYDNPEVLINIGDTSICVDSSILLYGIGAENYEWTNNFTNNNFYFPNYSGSISVVGTDTNNCSSSNSVYIGIDSCYFGEFEIVIPNIFTPDNNGNNDIFYISGTNFVFKKLSILNRWGETLFKTNEKRPWDGRLSSGQKAPEGTYFYILDITKYNNNVPTDTTYKQTLFLNR